MKRNKYHVQLGTYAVVGSNSIASPRIYVSSHVSAPAGEVDPITSTPLPPRRQVASRVQRRQAGIKAISQRVPLKSTVTNVAGASAQRSSAMPKHQSPPAKGLAMNKALAIIGCLVFVLGIMTLVKVSEMTEKSKGIDSVLTQITQCKKENDDLTVELAAASQDTDVWYNASQKLGMISAKGVSVVYLEAPQTRTAQVAQADVPPARSGIYATLFGFLD